MKKQAREHKRTDLRKFNNLSPENRESAVQMADAPSENTGSTVCRGIGSGCCRKAAKSIESYAGKLSENRSIQSRTPIRS